MCAHRLLDFVKDKEVEEEEKEEEECRISIADDIVVGRGREEITGRNTMTVWYLGGMQIW